ncbi:MAG: helix-turn-helix domain-containing protein [Bacteroides sp.]|nr:helix-turn-helix domain-containing protein [Bacteroides sp.]
MNKQGVPNIILPYPFIVVSGADNIPHENDCYPHRWDAGAFIFCTRGQLSFMVNLTDYTMEAGDLMTILPGSIIQFRERSADCQCFLILFQRDFIKGIHVFQSMLPLLSKIIEIPLISLHRKEQEFLHNYCMFLQDIHHNEFSKQHPDIHESLLVSVFHTVNAVYQKHQIEKEDRQHPRAEEIFRKFIHLVLDHYKEQRHVGFYADKLCITSKHLMDTVKKVSGKQVLEIITRAVILDAQVQLHSTRLSIQEISDNLHFPNASFFGKYFKRNVGVSPMVYRKELAKTRV